MKRTKKVVGLIVVLAMMLAFAACSGKDADDVSGKITPAVNNQEEATPTETAEEDVTPTEAVPTEAAPTEAASTDEVPPAVSIESKEDSYSVVLTEVGTYKVKVIKEVREVTGYGLKDAKDMVESAPVEIAVCEVKEDAEAIQKRLEDAGAIVTINYNGAEAEDTEESSDKTSSLGRVQGGVYVNEYMGVSCTLSSDWEFYTAEELQEIPDNVEEMFEGTDAEALMSNLDSITDMSAENATDLTSMNIAYQKMSFQERLAYQSLSNDDITKMVATDQKDVIIQMYAQAGINVHEMYAKTVTFCGEERLALYMACDVAGVAYYGLQIFDYSLGNYAVVLTTTSFVDDKTEEVLAMFEKYE